MQAGRVTWKARLSIPVDWNTPAILAARQEFVRTMHVQYGRNIVYVDETGFQLNSLTRNKVTCSYITALTVLGRGAQWRDLLRLL